MRVLLQHKVGASLFFALLVLTHVLWEYFHGGVTRHYLLARDDMPAFSNGWGLLTVPLFSYALLSLIQAQTRSAEASSTADPSALRRSGWGLAAGFAFGGAVALLWELRLEAVLAYLIYLPLLAALFAPVYRPEYVLGFVLAMAYTFGGVLPMVVGSVLVAIAFAIHAGLRGGILWLFRRLAR